MNTMLDVERLLRAHLAERADERPAEGALDAILAVTSAIPPRRSWRRTAWAGVAPDRRLDGTEKFNGRFIWVLVLLGLLLALGVGVMLIGGPNRRPTVVIEPTPRPVPLPSANHHNGPITIANDSGVIGFDPITGVQSNVATRPAVYAAWSPDGGRLATVNGSQLFVMDAQTGTTTRVTSLLDIRSPIAWSPNGKWVAYENIGGVHVVDMASGADTQLPAFPGSLDPPSDPSPPIDFERPSWTADGTAVRYTSIRATYATRVDGSGATVVGPLPASFAFYPAWSPDGTRLAYFLDPLRAPAPSVGDPYVLQLWVDNADNTNPTKVFELPGCCVGLNPSGPIWSPDGTDVAVALGSFGLEVVNPATRVARNLGASPSGDISWRPVP